MSAVIEGEIIEFGKFDYSELSPELACDCRMTAERIKRKMKRAAEDVIEIGQELIRIKEALPHGKFGPWIQHEFEMGQVTAHNMMNVARRFGGKFSIIENLNPTILYALAAPSTTEEVINKALERAETETITLATVRQIKQEAAAKVPVVVQPVQQPTIDEAAIRQQAKKEMESSLLKSKAEYLEKEKELKDKVRTIQSEMEEKISKNKERYAVREKELKDQLHKLQAEIGKVKSQHIPNHQLEHQIRSFKEEIAELQEVSKISSQMGMLNSVKLFLNLLTGEMKKISYPKIISELKIVHSTLGKILDSLGTKDEKESN